MNVYFSKTARQQLEAWQKSNPAIAIKIEELIDDIRKNGFLVGIGKPERLKYHSKPNRYSRRITQSDRLVYAPYQSGIIIIACKGHYEDS